MERSIRALFFFPAGRPAPPNQSPGLTPSRPVPSRSSLASIDPSTTTEEKGSPKKFNDVCRLIRGLTVADAIHQCALSPKRYAKVVMKVVASAAANAENNHDLDKDKLVIVQAFVGKGTYIKRSLPHGRGRSGVMTRPRTHIRIEVEEREPQEAPGGAFAAKGERRKMRIRDAEAPWKRHRRRALEKYRIAQEAGFV